MIFIGSNSSGLDNSVIMLLDPDGKKDENLGFYIENSVFKSYKGIEIAEDVEDGLVTTRGCYSNNSSIKPMHK